jgi:hypothetical protein
MVFIAHTTGYGRIPGRHRDRFGDSSQRFIATGRSAFGE